jgi:hypothetical protein
MAEQTGEKGKGMSVLKCFVKNILTKLRNNEELSARVDFGQQADRHAAFEFLGQPSPFDHDTDFDCVGAPLHMKTREFVDSNLKGFRKAKLRTLLDLEDDEGEFQNTREKLAVKLCYDGFAAVSEQELVPLLLPVDASEQQKQELRAALRKTCDAATKLTLGPDAVKWSDIDFKGSNVSGSFVGSKEADELKVEAKNARYFLDYAKYPNSAVFAKLYWSGFVSRINESGRACGSSGLMVQRLLDDNGDVLQSFKAGTERYQGLHSDSSDLNMMSILIRLNSVASVLILNDDNELERVVIKGNARALIFNQTRLHGGDAWYRSHGGEDPSFLMRAFVSLPMLSNHTHFDSVRTNLTVTQRQEFADRCVGVSMSLAAQVEAKRTRQRPSKRSGPRGTKTSRKKKRLAAVLVRANKNKNTNPNPPARGKPNNKAEQANTKGTRSSPRLRTRDEVIAEFEATCIKIEGTPASLTQRTRDEVVAEFEATSIKLEGTRFSLRLRTRNEVKAEFAATRVKVESIE